MKKSIYLLPLLALLLFSYSYADDVNVIKKGSYSVNLESIPIKTNSSIVEYFDIDSIGNKIPDQIFATVETGDWVSSLPNTVFVSDSNNIADKCIEYWDVSFAKVKDGGRVTFTRTIINNDSVDRESYSWNLEIRYQFVKYR